jgi:beta-lactamase regulating signal transducer with metallopeptidase domain
MNGLILESVGWALLHLVWQGALVGVALALALKAVGRRSANLRYALACGALGILLVLPVATAWRHHARASQARQVRTVAVWRHSGERPDATFVMRMDRTAIPATATASLPPLASLTQQVGEHLPWLVLAWGMGVATSSLRLLKGWVQLRRRVDSAVHASWEWQQRLEELARRLNLTRPVRLLVSSDLDVPSTLGWLKPVVLVPTATLTGLAVRELELVLAHELAHIRRHDFAVNVVQTFVETLLFYHPVVWWMSQVIRVERENCCDDLAVRQGPGAIPYARALTALEALRMQGLEAGGPALSSAGGSLKDRVMRLVMPPASRCSSRWAAGVSIVTLASSLGLAVPLTAMAMQPAKTPSVLPVVVGSPVTPPRTMVIESKARSVTPTTATPAPRIAVAAPAPKVAPSPLVAVTPSVAAAPIVAPSPLVAAAPMTAPAPRPAAEPAPAPAPKVAARPQAKNASEDMDAKTRVGTDDLTVDQLVSLRISGVTPEFVEQVKALGYEPTVSTLVGFRHSGITPEFAKAMTERFGQPIPADQLMGLRHLGVTPEWLGQMAAQGFAKASMDDLMGARALGIDPAWLGEMKSAGFPNLTLEEAMGMRALGVTASYLNDLAAAGVKPQNVDEVMRLKTGGVDADFLRRVRKPHP